MGKTLAAFQDEVKDELGSDLTGLYADIDTYIERWLNRGQDRLNYQFRAVSALTWAEGATTIALPANFERWGRYLRGTDNVALPAGHEVEGTYYIHDADGALQAGSGKLLYWAAPATISSSQASELPKAGDTALIAYCFYSFWNRIATSRADFEKYAVLVGQNGVDIEEVRSLAADRLDEFNEAKEEMPRMPSVTYYEG